MIVEESMQHSYFWLMLVPQTVSTPSDIVVETEPDTIEISMTGETIDLDIAPETINIEVMTSD